MLTCSPFAQHVPSFRFECGGAGLPRVVAAAVWEIAAAASGATRLIIIVFIASWASCSTLGVMLDARRHRRRRRFVLCYVTPSHTTRATFIRECVNVNRIYIHHRNNYNLQPFTTLQSTVIIIIIILPHVRHAPTCVRACVCVCVI